MRTFLHLLIISFGLLGLTTVFPPGIRSERTPSSNSSRVKSGSGSQSIDQRSPLSLASADFDEDGVPDLVIGYSDLKAGSVSVRLGNPDAVYPNSPAAQERKRLGKFTAVPFRPIARALPLPAAPDFIAAGDFDGDDHIDIVSAAHGSATLYLLPGKGNGSFAEIKSINLPGSVTNLVAGEIGRVDGLADLAVAVQTSDGPRLLTFQGPNGALKTEPQSFRLPGEVSSLTLADTDSDQRIEVLAASQSQIAIMSFAGARVASSESQQPNHILDLPAAVVSIVTQSGATGTQAPIALCENGRSYELNASTESFATRSKSSSSPTGFQLEPGAQILSSRLTPGIGLVAGKQAQLSLINSGNDRTSPAFSLHALNGPDLHAQTATSVFQLEDEPVAVLPLRLNASAFASLLILVKGHEDPFVLTPQAASTFTVINTNDSGAGSFRQAVLDANANAGADTIVFNIPGPAPYTISVLTQVPSITEAVTIDATTQPGFAGVPIIELNGANAGPINGLFVITSNVVIRGFVINRFSDYCVRFVTTGNNSQNNNILEGNFIGIDSSGHSPLGAFGVFVKASAAQIGGTTAAARNVIAPPVRVEADSSCCFGSMQSSAIIQGNYIGTDLNAQAAVGTGGITVTDPSSQGMAQATIGGTQAGARNIIVGTVSVSPRTNGATIQGNYIGSDVTGLTRLGNGGNISFNGILGLTVGGTTLSARNLIVNGISILSTVGCPPNFPQSPFALVQGNYIGSDVNGENTLGNTGNGVTIQSFAGAVIGGFASGAQNRIAFNGGDGINVNAACSNLIQGNAIFSNGGLGIRVNSPSLVTPPPTLKSAIDTGGQVVLEIQATGAPNSVVAVQFFSNEQCDPSGAGEGQNFLGTTQVTTDAQGVANFGEGINSANVTGQFLTATTTDSTNNTSAFSRCRRINAADISGQVTMSGNGFSGVLVILASGTQISGTTTTDANGNYLFENVPLGADYSVTPSKNNYAFSPPSQTFTNLSGNATGNFTAAPQTYTISGTVRKSGSPLFGATLTLTGTQSGSTQTDINGFYTFTVNSGGDYTVTPSKQDHIFAPFSTSFSNLQTNQTADFAATLLTHTISGRVVLVFSPLGGVTITLSGAQSRSAITDEFGRYTFTALPAGESYTVVPSLPPYVFGPPVRSYPFLVRDEIADFTAVLPFHRIEGVILNSNNAPLSNVIVNVSGSLSTSALTDANGEYSLRGLTEGGNYVVTPVRTNYTFSPPLRTFVNLIGDQTAVNFTGTLNNYSITGRISKPPNTSVAGVTVTLSGSQAATTTTDANGNYSFTAAGDGNYTVTPSSTSFTFSPSSLSFNNLSQNQSSANFTATPLPTMVSFSAANYNTGEGDVSVTVTVNRSGDTTGESTVDFATSNGSATQTRDYEVTSGTLAFAAGQTSRTFGVLIVDDAYAENSELINLTLSNPTGASLAAPSVANVTIADNDATATSPIARQFVANLTPGAVVPPVSSNGFGGGVFLLDQSETSAKVSLIYSQLSGTPFLATIRGPASPAVNGPVVFHLSSGEPVTNLALSPSVQEIADLRAGLHFMSVHTTPFANGEIRGQLYWNPAEEADFFVRQAYFDFLSRVPDAGGFAFWQSVITQCQSDVQCLRNKRVDVSNAFFYEQEFQQTAAYVLRLYRAAYGNNQPFPNPNSNPGFPNEEKKLPSYAVFVADRARVIGGANLAQKQLDLANLFVARSEFTTKYPASLATADQFVDAVLATLQTDLGVNLAGQRTNLINLYNQGGRGAVMYRLADDNGTNPIANQPFIDEEYNRTFVLGQYFGYLRRNPDIGGFVFWLSQVNGAPLRDLPRQHAMVCSFITSSEYQLRFGPVASRNNSECQ